MRCAVTVSVWISCSWTGIIMQMRYCQLCTRTGECECFVRRSCKDSGNGSATFHILFWLYNKVIALGILPFYNYAVVNVRSQCKINTVIINGTYIYFRHPFVLWHFLFISFASSHRFVAVQSDMHTAYVLWSVPSTMANTMINTFPIPNYNISITHFMPIQFSAFQIPSELRYEFTIYHYQW